MTWMRNINLYSISGKVFMVEPTSSNLTAKKLKFTPDFSSLEFKPGDYSSVTTN